MHNSPLPRPMFHKIATHPMTRDRMFSRLYLVLSRHWGLSVSRHPTQKMFTDLMGRVHDIHALNDGTLIIGTTRQGKTGLFQRLITAAKIARGHGKFDSTNAATVTREPVSMLKPSDIIELPKGHAFALLDGSIMGINLHDQAV